MGVCNCSMFCCTLLCVHSSIAFILMGKIELVALLILSSWCLVMVERLFLTVPRGCLQFVIVVFPDHTHLLKSNNTVQVFFLKVLFQKMQLSKCLQVCENYCYPIPSTPISRQWWSLRVNHRDYSCYSDCQRSSPVKQSTNHSHRYKTYRFPAIPSLHWRTVTNQLWSDHRFGPVSLVKPDMRGA